MMRSYLIIGMCVLFLVQYFLNMQWLEYTVVALSILAFLGSAFKADKFPRLLGIFMMTVGLVIEWNKGTGISGISQGIFLILPLISLIDTCSITFDSTKAGRLFPFNFGFIKEFITSAQEVVCRYYWDFVFSHPDFKFGFS